MTDYPFHPLADMFPLLEGDEFAALVEDIRAHSLDEPIVIFEGMILDGRNRDRACREAGAEPKYREIEFGDHAAAVAYVISKNIHRRHLTREQKRELIEKLLKANPERSNRQLAEMTGRDDKTVASVRKELEATAKIPQLEKTKGKDGKARPARKKPIAMDEAQTKPKPAEPAQPSTIETLSKPETSAAPKKPFDPERSTFVFRDWISNCLLDLLEESPAEADEIFEYLLQHLEFLNDLRKLVHHPKVPAFLRSLGRGVLGESVGHLMDERQFEIKYKGVQSEIAELKEQLEAARSEHAEPPASSRSISQVARELYGMMQELELPASSKSQKDHERVLYSLLQLSVKSESSPS